MELKPIKEKSETLYPTIKEMPKSNFMREMLLATAIMPPEQDIIYAVYVPSYAAEHPFLTITCKLTIGISIIIAILSLRLLFINKMKINKCISENEMTEKLEKLNKYRKTKWWIFGISIAIIVITLFVINYLENHYIM